MFITSKLPEMMLNVYEECHKPIDISVSIMYYPSLIIEHFYISSLGDINNFADFMSGVSEYVATPDFTNFDYSGHLLINLVVLC